MFDPTQRRYAWKQLVWDRVKTGSIMDLTFDEETSGIGRQGVPYATPNSPFISEWGDCLTDISGNYVDSFQLYPRQPEWLPPEVEALMIQRVPHMGPELLEDPERIQYWLSMAMIAHRAEEAAFDYAKVARIFGDKPTTVSLIDFNSAFKTGQKPGQKEATEQVYEIPLRDWPSGEIVHDVRYHPDRKRHAFRFNRDGSMYRSKEYLGAHNLFYRDENDGSLWKWVEPELTYTGFNIKGFDVPKFEANLERVAFSSHDAKFMRQRATISHTQRLRNHMRDVRDIAYAVAQHGPQGEGGLDLGRIINPDNPRERVRPSEALGRYIGENQGHANPLRLINGGPFNLDDGSFFDDQMAHAAVVDALATKGLDNLCMDIAPEIVAKMDAQIDEKRLHQVLTAQSIDGSSLPLFSLPRKEGGRYHSDLPYWFLGTDDDIGRFKRMIYLRADGSLHTQRFNGKLLCDLDLEEMVDFIKGERKGNDPDKAVRVESVKRHPPVMDLESVFENSSQATRYRGAIDDMVKDIAFIIEHPEFGERVLQAQAVINHEQRFRTLHPQLELIEDTFGRRNAGEIAFQDTEREIEARMIAQQAGRSGGKTINGALQTIHAHMNSEYKFFFSAIDDVLDELMVKPMAVDVFGVNPKLAEEVGLDEDTAFENFLDLLKKRREKMKKKKWPYLKIIDGLVDPQTGEPFFKKGKFQGETVQDAYRFRTTLADKCLQSYDRLITASRLSKEKRDFIEGGVLDADFCTMEHNGELLLYSDIDNGQSGNEPYLVDKAGREISIEDIKACNAHIDYRNGTSQGMRDLIDKMINKGEWRVRYYRDPAETRLMRLIHRRVNLGMKGTLPETLRQSYEADLANRWLGFENETVDNARSSNVHTMALSAQNLMIGASDQGVTERAADPYFPVALKMLQYEEGRQRLEHITAYIRRKRTEMEAVARRTGLLRGTDPQTQLPYDAVRHIIARDSRVPFEADPGFFVMDVPSWHLRHPISHRDPKYPFSSLIVPGESIAAMYGESWPEKPAAQKRLVEKFRGAVKRGKPIVARGIEDARLTTLGPVDLTLLSPGDTSAELAIEKAAADYARTGHALDTSSPLYMIGIEGVFPLVNSRAVDLSLQTFKLPGLHFDGLSRAHALSSYSHPLTAILTPVDYFPQRLVPGERVRLAEMNARMFHNIHGFTDSQETGHMYETVLDKVYGLDETGRSVGYTMKELLQKLESGEIDASMVRETGFLGVDHMKSVVKDWVTSKWKGNEDGLRFVWSRVGRVNAAYFDGGRHEVDNSWAFVPLAKRPDAGFSIDHTPIPPHSYRPV